MRKVYADVKVRLIINADEGVSIFETLENMDYNFTSSTDGADIVDTEIKDCEITDSK
jgi:hypothetical protein